MVEISANTYRTELVNLNQIQQLRHILGDEKLKLYLKMALDHCYVLTQKDLANLTGDALKEQTHSLVGSAGNTGLNGIAECARSIEAAVRAEEDIKPLIQKLYQIQQESGLILAEYWEKN